MKKLCRKRGGAKEEERVIADFGFKGGRQRRGPYHFRLAILRPRSGQVFDWTADGNGTVCTASPLRSLRTLGVTARGGRKTRRVGTPAARRFLAHGGETGAASSPSPWPSPIKGEGKARGAGRGNPILPRPTVGEGWGEGSPFDRAAREKHWRASRQWHPAHHEAAHIAVPALDRYKEAA